MPLLSFGCHVAVNVLWLLLTVSWAGLQFVIVVFHDHTHLLSKCFRWGPPERKSQMPKSMSDYSRHQHEGFNTAPGSGSYRLNEGKSKQKNIEISFYILL